VVICDPQDIKQVFTADPAAFDVGMANTLLQPLLGKRSVTLLEEPEHIERRKLVLPRFHGEYLQHYSQIIGAIAREHVRGWPVGEPFALWPRMQEITLDVTMGVVFGREERARLESLREQQRRFTRWLNDERQLTGLALLGPRWLGARPSFRRMRAKVRDEAMAELHRRRAERQLGEENKDLLSVLMQARYDDSSPLSDQDVADELVTLLSDGPAATLITWAFERLLRHPSCLACLQAETHAGGHRYLEAVVKETLRLCPAVPLVLRRLRHPTDVGGYTLPAGVAVAPCIHLVHRRPDTYPRPLEFRPERFLDAPISAYAWIPFGGGARRCIAASLAQLEMTQVIQTVLSELELHPVDARSERATRSSIGFSPDQHGLVIATRRPQTRGHEHPGLDELAECEEALGR
jgi:cytochrome P450